MNERSLATEARRVRGRVASPRRYIVGIAGIPGAGKSTLARRLCDAINAVEPSVAIVLPMDGFHSCNDELSARGLRDRKGAPETFDTDAYLLTLRRASAGECFSFPIYDRTLHEPLLAENPQQTLTPAVRIVVTEGNYLLLSFPPWSDLAGVLDETWFLEEPVEVARQRILCRHQSGGRSESSAATHYQRVDLPNTQLVLTRMRNADRIVRLGTV